MKKLFTEFGKLQNEEALKFNKIGSGLGLSTCRKIISKLGNEISVESKPNNSTRFSFSLSNKTQIRKLGDYRAVNLNSELKSEANNSINSNFNNKNFMNINKLATNNLLNYTTNSQLNILNAQSNNNIYIDKYKNINKIENNNNNVNFESMKNNLIVNDSHFYVKSTNVNSGENFISNLKKNYHLNRNCRSISNEVNENYNNFFNCRNNLKIATKKIDINVIDEESKDCSSNLLSNNNNSLDDKSKEDSNLTINRDDEEKIININIQKIRKNDMIQLYKGYTEAYLRKSHKNNDLSNQKYSSQIKKNFSETDINLVPYKLYHNPLKSFKKKTI